jgi:DNA repair protein RecO (recombination protein O)
VAVARARPQDSVRTTRALVLKRVEYGESDLVLTLFTERFGRVSALARAARKSTRRFAGALEPMHTLELALEERPKSELFVLREARIAEPRTALTESLARLEAAGTALAWVRRAAPPRTPEPELWAAVESLLDRLGSREEAVPPRRTLAAAGLRILATLGWGLDLTRCVRCGKECPPGQIALVDPTRGGLVCRACGGARLRLDGPARERLARAAATGDPTALEADDADRALALVEGVLTAHAGLE